jgi:hypothetical protein
MYNYVNMPSSYEGYNITGIVGRINSDPLSAVKLKKNNKLEFFEKLPQSVVKKACEEGRGLPVLLGHDRNQRIGRVQRFYTKPLNNKERALFVDLYVNSTDFINELDKHHTDFRARQGELPNPDKNEHRREALFKRLPGLSLGHLPPDATVAEVSLCRSGARLATIVTDVRYGDIKDKVSASNRIKGFCTNKYKSAGLANYLASVSVIADPSSCKLQTDFEYLEGSEAKGFPEITLCCDYPARTQSLNSKKM